MNSGRGKTEKGEGKEKITERERKIVFKAFPSLPDTAQNDIHLLQELTPL